ncbi:L-amino acid N-acyltransferase YncA [Monaibacterium marinum]|uniref:L-amino acid N-acyltransferase YncA n=1 Tax=Pontivivens marinum TaxID=1690039 RepID=A0A2C9CUC7_9RHOB|nr:GNAT family N-acetyltransferase [Monaibacterium marinum]SOH95121.1 L-amino acid N-acyltransferase YncA [Monaibacterium marinum]
MIRPATPDDLAEVTRIARAAYTVYVDELGPNLPPMVQDFSPDIAAGHLWVCEGGYICAKPMGKDWLIENVAVDPAYAGQGIGRRLMLAAEGAGRDLGFHRAVLYTNAAMTANLMLYPRLGYTETHRVTEHNLHRVYFAKPL